MISCGCADSATSHTRLRPTQASAEAKSGDINDDAEASIESLLAELVDFPPRLIQLIQQKVQPVTFRPAEDILKMRELGSGLYFIMQAGAIQRSLGARVDVGSETRVTPDAPAVHFWRLCTARASWSVVAVCEGVPTSTLAVPIRSPSLSHRVAPSYGLPTLRANPCGLSSKSSGPAKASASAHCFRRSPSPPTYRWGTTGANVSCSARAIAQVSRFRSPTCPTMLRRRQAARRWATSRVPRLWPRCQCCRSCRRAAVERS